MITHIHFTRSLKRSLAILALLIFILMPGLGWGQTNPAAFDLSTGSFSFTTQTATNTTYPTNMQGWTTGTDNIATLTTAAPGGDQALVASGSAGTSGLSNLGDNGFNFLSTGSSPNQQVGAICVALNSTGRYNLQVSWTAADQTSSAAREMNITLQYRIGTSGIFTTVSGGTYTTSNSSQKAAQNFTNIALPSACENQPVVQLRWITYESPSQSGNRDAIRLDDISVSSTNGAIFNSTQDGLWNNAATWGGTVPTAGATVNIVNNVTIAAVGGISNSGIININSGGTLLCSSASGTSLNGAGTVNVNTGGTLDIEPGGWPGNTNTFIYSATGTLKFNNSSGPYGVNTSDTWWPASSGPQNVNVAGVGGITMNVARTVTGTFQTAASVTNANNFTFNGTAQINTGGSITGIPTYGSSSTLIYKTGASFTRGNEWTTSSSGPGYPNNVQISNTGTNTTLNMGSTAAKCAGSITVDASATLNTTTAGLTVFGSVISNGAINLKGDVYVAGNWTIGASGAQNNNGKAVSFNAATGDQTVAKTGGGIVYFDYLAIDKATSGNVVISSSPATDITINTTTGSVLQLNNNGGLDLNGRTLALNYSGGGIYVNGNRTITSTVSGGKIDINQYKYIANNSGTGSLTCGPNVTVNLNANGNLDFGKSGGTYITTLNGTLSINSTTSCFVNNNPPIYGGTSLLKYNSTGSYGRGLEWSATSGAGYPNDIQISGNTTLNYPNTDANNTTSLSLARDLTIDNGSALYMDYGLGTSRGSVTVGRNISIAGNLSLGDGVGGDLNVGGNWNHTTGTFADNSRAVTFNGATGDQTITKSGGETFTYLTVNKGTSGNIILANDITVTATLTLTKGLITTSSNKVIASGTISSASASSYVDGKLAQVYSGTGSKTFPIGKGGNYRPVALNYTALSGTSTVTAEQFETDLPGTAPAGTTIFAGRYWNISESGSTSRTYTLTLDGTGLTAPTHTPKIFKDNTAFTASYSSPNFTATGLTSFSNFGLGEASISTTTTTADVAVCHGSSSVTLNANVNPAPSPDGGSVTFYVDGNNVGSANVVSGTATLTYDASGLAANTYNLQANFSGSGDYLSSNSATQTFTVNPLPTASISGNNSPICSGNDATFTLSGTSGATATYNINSGSDQTIVLTSGSAIVTVTAATSDQTLTLVSVTNGTCPNTLGSTSTVTVNALPAIFNVTGTASYCQGSGGTSVGLDGSQTGVNYVLWKNGSATANSVTGTGSAISFGNNISNGTYTVVATNTTTLCPQTMADNAVITEDPNPEAAGPITGTATVTEGTTGVSYSIVALANATSYTWSYTGSGVTINDYTTNSVTLDFAAGATGGTLSAAGHNNCGDGSAATFDITVNPAVTTPTVFNVTGGGSYCASGAPTGIPVGLDGSQSGVTYTLYNGSTAQTPTVAGTGANITFGNHTAGTYTVKANNGGADVAMNGNAVIAADGVLPTAVITPNIQSAQVDAPYAIQGASATPANATYEWTISPVSTSDGTFTGTNTLTPVFNASVSGTATLDLKVTSSPGCFAYSSVNIFVTDPNERTWVGGISDDWATAGNWYQASVPTSSTNVVIPVISTSNHYPNISDSRSCNKIHIASGASLLGNGNLTVTGVSVIARELTPAQWHFFSVPNTVTTANVFYGSYLGQWDEPTAKWSYIYAPATTLDKVKGYRVWNNTGANRTYSFTGTFLSGNQSWPITKSTNGSGFEGANLLGNPYPSYLDWSTLNSSYGAVYYWNGSGYNSWNGTGDGSQFVAPLQGFFIVKDVNVTKTSFDLTEANRANTVTGTYYKSASAILSNSLVLRTEGEAYTDKLYLVFNPATTPGFDLANDAYKLPNSSGISTLYSYAGDKKLSIDARPETDVIQLGFSNTASGQYQIGLQDVADIPVVVLEDTKTNTFHDLLTGAYAFSYTAGENDKRFVLHLGINSVKEAEKAPALIYSYQKTVHIDMKDQQKGDIFVYTISGQLVKSITSASGSNQVKLPVSGNYIVKVVGRDNTVVRKVWIQQ